MNNTRITLEELWRCMLNDEHYKDNGFILNRLDKLKHELPTSFDDWIKPWYLERKIPQAKLVFALCCLGMRVYLRGKEKVLLNSDETYKKIASNLELFEVEKPDLAGTLRQYDLTLPSFWFQDGRDTPSNEETGQNIMSSGGIAGIDAYILAIAKEENEGRRTKLAAAKMRFEDINAPAWKIWDEVCPKENHLDKQAKAERVAKACQWVRENHPDLPPPPSKRAR